MTLLRDQLSYCSGWDVGLGMSDTPLQPLDDPIQRKEVSSHGRSRCRQGTCCYPHESKSALLNRMRDGVSRRPGKPRSAHSSTAALKYIAEVVLMFLCRQGPALGRLGRQLGRPPRRLWRLQRRRRLCRCFQLCCCCRSGLADTYSAVLTICTWSADSGRCLLGCKTYADGFIQSGTCHWLL